MNLHAHEKFLWGLCYRMTGSAADADDLVQDTFARTLESPPRDLNAPLRPWLTRVAVNLARDQLRRRRRAPYVGPWLPSPIETEPDGASPVAVEPKTTEGRYDLLESVSFAFLLALEALNPKQRAVLLLCDVFDYSVKDVAQALDLSTDNVKQLHLRARRAMAEYDQHRTEPTRAMQQRNEAALNQLIGALLSNDTAAVEALLAADVKLLSDGAGRYHAAMNPIFGPQKVARFLFGVHEKRGPPSEVRVGMINGFPAVIAYYPPHRDPKLAPIAVTRLDLDAAGKIRALHSVLAPLKLGHLKPAA